MNIAVEVEKKRKRLKEVESLLSQPEASSDMKKMTELNREYAAKWPGINNEIGAMPEAEKWKAIEAKFDQFDPAPGNPNG